MGELCARAWRAYLGKQAKEQYYLRVWLNLEMRAEYNKLVDDLVLGDLGMFEELQGILNG